MDADALHWLALNRLPALSPAELRALGDERASPRDILAAHAGTAPDWRQVESDLDWLQSPGRHLLTLSTAGYPMRLRHIADPPPVLFVDGDPQLLSSGQLAMVGSRRATPWGVDTAHDFSAELAGLGLTITSGLAVGIDAASHRGAMAAGGRTLAVMAHGLDRVYPRGHGRTPRG